MVDSCNSIKLGIGYIDINDSRINNLHYDNFI